MVSSQGALCVHLRARAEVHSRLPEFTPAVIHLSVSLYVCAS